MKQRLGDLELRRVPHQPKQPLRAWDAADEFVLEHLADDPVSADARVLLVNDSFGALTCGLHHLDPVVVNESAAGRAAIALNLAANNLEPVEAISILDLDQLDGGPFDVVVIKVPKANAHLADALYRLRPHIHPQTRIIGASMVKHLHTSALDLFTEIIGPTTTSLAKKKARLVHATFSDERASSQNPWPAEWTEYAIATVNYGGGFSPSSLDIGTRTLLEQVTDFAELVSADPARIVDLGCGNGVIGLRVARDFAQAGRSVEVVAIDDSALALAGAKASWEKNTISASLQLHHHHRMVEVLDPGTVDLVVVNPPFHTDRVIDDQTAWSMFTDSHRVLHPGGSLIVVGNRHLGYHAKLRKIFGSVDAIASTSKFVVHVARR